MTECRPDPSMQRWARLAGFMYLFVMAVYLAGLALASGLVVAGDPLATARRIASAETLYRGALACQLVASWSTILLGGAFYVLLRPVDAHLALLALMWRTAEATLGGVTAAVAYTALENLRSLAAAPPAAMALALAPLMTAGYHVAFHIAVIFFSPGSALFFWLLGRSRLVPRMLAGFGLVASLLVTVLGFLRLVLPPVADAVAPAWAAIFVAEIATGAYLLRHGAAAWSTMGGAARPAVSHEEAR